MAEPRRGKIKRKQFTKDDDSEKPTKEEYAIAKFLRFNAPSKEGKFLGNSVQYFTGSKAVDALFESKWSARHAKTNALFTNRASCSNYCEGLLHKGFFHRVAKPEKREKKKKLKDTAEKAQKKEEKKQDKKSKKDEPGESKKEKELEQKDKKEKELKHGDENADLQKDDSGQEDKKRKKKKLKLEMHDKQIFLDSSDLYVWIYDPVPVKTFIIGLLLVLGAIAVCLFPLWPPEVKLGVYYLSVAGALFIGLILLLCIVRGIVFAVVWLLTLGKVTLWLLPNLTEDVGFFESFRPIYKCEFKDQSKKEEKDVAEEAGKDDAGEKKEEAEENSDGDAAEKLEQYEDGKTKEDGGSEDEDEEGERKEEEDEEEECNEEELDREGSRHSGSSNDNGYEIVDKDDVEDMGKVEEDLGQADREESDEEDENRQRQRHRLTKKARSSESKKTK